MSLCWLMQSDFLYGTGSVEPVTKESLYTKYDLEYGWHFANDYLREGVRRAPLYGYSLWRFRAWCQRRLRQLGVAHP